jgi:hypothetical protein
LSQDRLIVGGNFRNNELSFLKVEVTTWIQLRQKIKWEDDVTEFWLTAVTSTSIIFLLNSVHGCLNKLYEQNLFHTILYQYCLLWTVRAPKCKSILQNLWTLYFSCLNTPDLKLISTLCDSPLH